MKKRRRNFGKRNQDKGTLMEEGVGDIKPLLLDNLVAIEEDIQVDNPRPPPPPGDAAPPYILSIICRRESRPSVSREVAASTTQFTKSSCSLYPHGFVS